MGNSVLSGALERLSSGGWIANVVIGVVFLLLSPILAGVLQRPRAAIISAASGLTIVIWVVAWAAYSAVPPVRPSEVEAPRGRDAEQDHSPPPVSPHSKPELPAKSVADGQSATLQRSPNSTIYQAGRDVIVNQPLPSSATIHSMVLEVRLTCELTESHGDLPPDEVPFVPLGDAHAYLDGPAGRERLTFVSPVRFRKLANGRIVIVNRFVLDAGGDLQGRPTSVLLNYQNVVTPVITIVWGKEFAKMTLLELSVSLNGSDPAYYSWPYDAPFQQGPVFTVPFSDMRARLLRTER
jgi:hypothetical protein